MMNEPHQWLPLLTQAIQQLHAQREPDQILQSLVESAIELTGADAGAHGQYQGGAIQIDRIFAGNNWQTVDKSCGLGEGMAGQMLEQAEPLFCNGCQEDRRAAWLKQYLPGVRTLVAVPLTGFQGDELLGCLELYRSESEVCFSEADVLLLQPLLASAVAALANVRRMATCMDTQREIEACLSRFKSSQQFADLGTWDWNIQTGELYWSEQIGPLFGYQPGELETSYENFLAAVHPDDRQAVIDAVNASIEQDDPYEIEHRVVWPDGTIRWVLERGDVRRTRAGEPLHMLGIVKDITRRRETELALRESEARFRGLVESTSDWIWEVDQRGRYTYVSPQVERILGYSPASLIGKSPFDLMPATESTRVQLAFFTRVKNRQPISHLTNTNIHASGREVILETSGLPFYDSEGQFGGYRGIDRDITDRKIFEQALKEQTLRNRFILENSHDGFIIINLDGSIQEVNDAYCRMVGYERRALLEMNMADLEMSGSVRETEAHIKRISRYGHDHFETSHKGSDGRVVDLDVSATLARVGERQFIFSFLRDITERRLREQQRLKAVQAQRDTLVQEIHHRIKNHLQGIINLLRNHIRENPQLADVLESAIGQVESIALVHGLQSQLNHGRIELTALLEVICKAISHLTFAGIQPVIESPATAVVVRSTDAVPVALILNELLQNAVKHGAPAETSAVVEVRFMVENGQAIVQVSNAAPVPLPADLCLQQGVGLGTGLTLARDLVPHQGASLSLTSVAGRVDARLVLEAPVIELEPQPLDQDFSVPN